CPRSSTRPPRSTAPGGGRRSGTSPCRCWVPRSASGHSCRSSARSSSSTWCGSSPAADPCTRRRPWPCTWSSTASTSRRSATAAPSPSCCSSSRSSSPCSISASRCAETCRARSPRGCAEMTSVATRPGRRGFDWSQPVVYLVALVVAALAVGPVLYVTVAGFRTNPDFFADPAGLPNPWVLDNYASILGDAQFWRQVLASTVTALGTTAGVMLLGVMAAFVIARYEFTGRRFLYALFTTGLLFPLTISILPL